MFRTAVTRALWLTLPLVLMLVLFALTFARLRYAKPNPYTPYLNLSLTDVRSFASCYNDGYASYIRAYCIQTTGQMSVSFTIGMNGQIASVGFYRPPVVVYVGDLYAWYGAPDRVNAAAHWVAYYWHGSPRLMASARADNLYARVTFIHFDVQTDFQTALP